MKICYLWKNIANVHNFVSIYTIVIDVTYYGEELDSEQEMDNYLVCVVALHKLMQIELALMKGIIEPTHQPRVFELIVKEAMDSIVQDGEVCTVLSYTSSLDKPNEHSNIYYNVGFMQDIIEMPLT